MTAATEFKVPEDLLERYFSYVNKEGLKSERFRKETPEKQAELVAVAKERCLRFMNETVERVPRKDIGLLKNSTFHPTNKFSRELFAAITGIELPKSVNGTHEAVEAYIGEEILAAEAARIEADRLDKEGAAKRELDKRLAGIKLQFDFGITGDEMLLLVENYGIKLHPRTVGTIRRRLSLIGPGSVSVFGRGSLPDTVLEVWRCLNRKIKAEKACKSAE